MKVRNGFVTNSSSSSYIVAIKGGALSKDVIEAELQHLSPLVRGIVRSSLNLSSTLFEKYVYLVKTDEELKNFIVDHYGYGDYDTFEKIIEHDDRYALKRYERYSKYVVDGYCIYWLDISYHDEELQNIIRSMCDGDYAILVEVDD